MGLLSSAIPWTLELEAMRRLPSHAYGVLVSLSPAIAAVSGAILLGEHLHAHGWLAVFLVVLASAGAARWSAARLPTEVSETTQ